MKNTLYIAQYFNMKYFLKECFFIISNDINAHNDLLQKHEHYFY